MGRSKRTISPAASSEIRRAEAGKTISVRDNTKKLSDDLTRASHLRAQDTFSKAQHAMRILGNPDATSNQLLEDIKRAEMAHQHAIGQSATSPYQLLSQRSAIAAGADNQLFQATQRLRLNMNARLHTGMLPPDAVSGMTLLYTIETDLAGQASCSQALYQFCKQLEEMGPSLNASQSEVAYQRLQAFQAAISKKNWPGAKAAVALQS
jgi:hypothetical protein